MGALWRQMEGRFRCASGLCHHAYSAPYNDGHLYLLYIGIAKLPELKLLGRFAFRQPPIVVASQLRSSVIDRRFNGARFSLKSSPTLARASTKAYCNHEQPTTRLPRRAVLHTHAARPLSIDIRRLPGMMSGGDCGGPQILQRRGSRHMGTARECHLA